MGPTKLERHEAESEPLAVVGSVAVVCDSDGDLGRGHVGVPEQGCCLVSRCKLYTLATGNTHMSLSPYGGRLRMCGGLVATRGNILVGVHTKRCGALCGDAVAPRTPT